ncbi:MAG: FtsX-like permease family protein, partial [Candidatus Odinarchaeota archaeon]|nr:FtsX-like permease family protein [Candidatus Odinarchaeota archaeon]
LTLVYYISLDSKKKEISIVKALGASQMDVFLYVSLEYALLLFFAMTFGTIGNIGAISLIYISILKVEGRIITINTLISDVFKVMSFEYISFVGLFIAIVLMSQIFITTREIYKKETISALREL